MYITVMVNISLYSMLGDTSFSSIQEDCVHTYVHYTLHTYVRTYVHTSHLQCGLQYGVIVCAGCQGDLLVLDTCEYLQVCMTGCVLCCHGNAACTICLLSAAGETRGQSVVCSVQLRQCCVSYNTGYRPRERVWHTKCLFHVDDSRVSAEMSKFVD